MASLPSRILLPGGSGVVGFGETWASTDAGPQQLVPGTEDPAVVSLRASASGLLMWMPK